MTRRQILALLAFLDDEPLHDRRRLAIEAFLLALLELDATTSSRSARGVAN